MSPKFTTGGSLAPSSGGHSPVPIEPPAPVDDLEAWRARMEAKRGHGGVVHRIPVVAPPEAPPAQSSQPAPTPAPAPAPTPAPSPRRAPSAPAPLSTPPDTAPDLTPQVPESPLAPAAAVTPRRRAMRRAEIKRHEAVITEYLAGATIPALAETYGHSTSTIRRWLLDADVVLRDDRATRSGGKPKTTGDDDPELRAAAISEYEAGATLEQVAAAHDVTPKIVSGILRRAGVQLRPAASVEQVSAETIEQIRVLYVEEGLSQSQVAQRLGLPSQAAVSKIMRRHNIPRRSFGHPAAPVVAPPAPGPAQSPSPSPSPAEPASTPVEPTEDSMTQPPSVEPAETPLAPSPVVADTASAPEPSETIRDAIRDVIKTVWPMPSPPAPAPSAPAPSAPAPSALTTALTAVAALADTFTALRMDLTRREKAIVLAALAELADPSVGEWE